MKRVLRIFVSVTLCLIVVGCSGQSDLSTYEKYFKLVDLSEYSLEQSDTVVGLGGNWASLKFERKENSNVTRKVILERFLRAMKEDGWSIGILPKRKYVLSDIYETSNNDLYFVRKSREKEPEYWFFNMAVYISKNADTICVYAELGR